MYFFVMLDPENQQWSWAAFRGNDVFECGETYTTAHEACAAAITWLEKGEPNVETILG